MPRDLIDAKRFPTAPPGWAIRAVLGARQFLRRLVNRMAPADVALVELATGLAGSQVLGALARLDIGDRLDAGPRTAGELAGELGLHADALHRLLRAAATFGLVTLDKRGRFGPTRYTRALRTGELGRARDFAVYFASASNAAAWGDLQRTLETGRGAFPRVHGMSVWDWFDAHPDERETFAQCMMGMTTRDAPSVASRYPFSELKTVCDVGGGRGTLLSEILLRHPHLRGVLCDAPGVLESARELVARRGVADRVDMRPGNFFHEVPTGADAYLLKNILHDWDDTACKKILGVVRAAMQPGRRLLVVELIQDRNQPGFVALSDVHMMMVCDDGRERSVDEIHALLSESGFRPARTFRDDPAPAVLEAVAV
jgi:hypothetical protein